LERVFLTVYQQAVIGCGRLKRGRNRKDARSQVWRLGGAVASGRVERRRWREVWYLRHYDAAGLTAFTGDAVMLGPTLYIQFTPKMFMTAAWNTQVWDVRSAIPSRSI
jgi:hypothetical protein